jgi:membrane protein DedA with SNARE-associated domain
MVGGARMMRRQRSGFEWPVIAAAIIFTAGRVIFVTVLNYEDVGIAAVLPIALAILVGGVLAWRRRRQIREWAAKEPPEPR